MLEPVTIEVAWRGVTHRVRWERGRLVLLDHDVPAERALEALGGERDCPCLDILDLWRAPAVVHAGLADFALEHDLAGISFEALTAARMRRATMPTGASFGRAGASSAGLMRAIAASWSEDQRRVYAQLVFACLPADMRSRVMAAAVVAEHRAPRSGRWPSDDAVQLVGTVRRLATPPLQRSLQLQHRMRAGLRLSVAVTCVYPDHPDGAGVDGTVERSGGEVRLRLPVRWLADVWAPGVAEVDGWFVLSVTGRRRRDRLEAAAVRWRRRPDGWLEPSVERVELARTHGQWVAVAPPDSR